MKKYRITASALPAVVAAIIVASAARTASAQTARYDILIPHIAVGGGYTSILDISDPIGTESRVVELSFFDDSGQPLPVKVGGTAAAGSYRLSLPRYEERSLALASDDQTTRTGWVRIVCDRGSKLYVSLRFVVAGSSGIGDSVGILPSGVQRTWYVPVDRQQSNENTGIAVANPNGFAVDVEFNWYQGPNRVPGTTSERRALPPMGHLSRFVSELFPVNFTGIATLEIYGIQGNVAAVALHASGSQYSFIPAQPAVELWNYAVTDAGGSVLEGGTWCWKYNESTGFHGVAAVALQRFDLRGSFEGNRFELVRFSTPAEGAHFFTGVLQTEAGRAVIRGARLEIGDNGTVLRTATFTANRLP